MLGWQEGSPAHVAAEAGPRAADVFMGVDAFGRGTYGGGGLTCDVAIRAAFDAGAADSKLIHNSLCIPSFK